MAQRISTIHEFGPFRLDSDAGILFHGAEPLLLGERAIALLRLLIERPGAPPEEVRKANIPVEPDDRIRVQTSGGGGYSDPLKREPSKVAADVRFGYVSREAAERLYGVLLDSRGAVLERETAERRVQLAAKR